MRFAFRFWFFDVAQISSAEQVCLHVGNNGIEWNIPWLRGKASGFLMFVRKSKHERATNAWMTAAKGKGAVVITAAHAESMAMFVESEQRCDDKIKMSW